MKFRHKLEALEKPVFVVVLCVFCFFAGESCIEVKNIKEHVAHHDPVSGNYVFDGTNLWLGWEVSGPKTNYWLKDESGPVTIFAPGRSEPIWRTNYPYPSQFIITNGPAGFSPLTITNVIISDPADPDSVWPYTENEHVLPPRYDGANRIVTILRKSNSGWWRNTNGPMSGKIDFGTNALPSWLTNGSKWLELYDYQSNGESLITVKARRSDVIFETKVLDRTNTDVLSWTNRSVLSLYTNSATVGVPAYTKVTKSNGVCCQILDQDEKPVQPVLQLISVEEEYEALPGKIWQSGPERAEPKPGTNGYVDLTVGNNAVTLQLVTHIEPPKTNHYLIWNIGIPYVFTNSIKKLWPDLFHR